MCVTGLGLPIFSDHDIYYLCLHLLGLLVLGGANLCTRVTFLQLRAGGRSIKGLRLPEVCFHMSASLLPPPLPPGVARSSSRAFQSKTVEWALAGLNTQTFHRSQA